MKFIFEPSVYLIAKQQNVEEEIDRFLKDENIENWTTDAFSPAEKNVEISGRLCYMSFTKPRPGGNSKYIGHIKEVGHGCYDEETEVLTEDGWKKFKNVSIDQDLFATLNPITLKLEYQKASNKIDKKYNGLMYKLKSSMIDLLVTPDHRMFIQKHDTQKAKRKEQPWEIIEANKIKNKRVKYKKNCNWEGKYIANYTLPTINIKYGKGYKDIIGKTFNIEDWVKFLGYWCSEGSTHYTKGSSYRINLYQNPGYTLENMRSCLKNMGYSPFERISKNSNNRLLVICDQVLFHHLHDICGKLSYNKKVPSFIKKLNKELIQIFLDAYIEGDGNIHKTNGHKVIYTSSKQMADDLQELILKVGLSASIKIDDRVGKPREGKWKNIKQTRPNYIVSISSESRQEPLVNHNGSIHNTFEKYNGNIYCVTVPNSLLYVRRNGIPVWSGNSVTEHANWTLLLTGVSRSLCMELIRHRHFNFSMLSQRYVDETECNMVVPPELQKEVKMFLDSKETIKDPMWESGRYWLLSVNNAIMDYKYQTEYLFNKLVPEAYLDLKLGECGAINLSIDDMMKKIPMEKRTELRKRARQTARSLLPNATESKIVITVNARSLRNFLELRGSSHADSEIRLLANKIFDIIVKESPSLFNDYEKIPLEDGSFELKTKFTKI